MSSKLLDQRVPKFSFLCINDDTLDRRSQDCVCYKCEYCSQHYWHGHPAQVDSRWPGPDVISTNIWPPHHRHLCHLHEQRQVGHHPQTQTPVPDQYQHQQCHSSSLYSFIVSPVWYPIQKILSWYILFRLSWPISSLRILAIGGEKCSEESKRRLMTAWRSGVMVFHMYGLTEMSVWQTMTRMTSERMIIEMPILVKHQNLLSGKTIFSLSLFTVNILRQ